MEPNSRCHWSNDRSRETTTQIGWCCDANLLALRSDGCPSLIQNDGGVDQFDAAVAYVLQSTIDSFSPSGLMSGLGGAGVVQAAEQASDDLCAFSLRELQCFFDHDFERHVSSVAQVCSSRARSLMTAPR